MTKLSWLREKKSLSFYCGIFLAKYIYNFKVNVLLTLNNMNIQNLKRPCQAQPQLQLELWLRLAKILISQTTYLLHATKKVKFDLILIITGPILT